jgi:two-component system phosphate regulon sensor histidine kinase PhoR
MENRKHKSLLYFIGLVIMVTLCIQLYWNYKNYQSGRQQLINEVQNSLDQAIDKYYINMAERNTRFFISKNKDSNLIGKIPPGRFKFLSRRINVLDSIPRNDFLGRRIPQEMERIRVLSDREFDSLSHWDLGGIRADYAPSPGDTPRLKGIRTDYARLADRVIATISVDTLFVSELNPFIREQLAQKSINVDFGYTFTNFFGRTQDHNMGITEKGVLKTKSKSAYLPPHSNFTFYFTNETSTILKRNLFGMFLSALLIFSVIACLLFLLKIINRQKQLAEVKNDLIDNITHEFKTPISTIKVALEGMEKFNRENNPVKNKNYLRTSNDQLDKLQTMVEKLLETATLDGSELQLKKERVAVDKMLPALMEKYRELAKNKHFHISVDTNNTVLWADPFHLENALNNILDNAVKYGGDTIKAVVSQKKDTLKIIISDNGKDLTKAEGKQLFEKFYRVPKGNVHDVKGFGIGLYYTRNIIEKHGGNIVVELDGSTNFIISLPNG